MTAGVVVAFSCIVLIFLAMSTFDDTHRLLPWVLAPFLGVRRLAHVSDREFAESETPEGILVKQLQDVNLHTEPKKAQQRHTAIGNLLRASGTSKRLAVSHFEAARDAAKHGGDPDALLASHIGLAEAYAEEGRSLDSQHELSKASGVVADHFAENVVSLNRARGRAKFELGFAARALEYYEEAWKHAVQPEDIARVTCDIGMVRTCLGAGDESVKNLGHALTALQSAYKSGANGGMSDALYTSLTGEVHFRLAEAFHSMKNFGVAQVHYEKALNLQRKISSFRSDRVSAIQNGLKNIARGIAPDLHCPSSPQAPWEIPKNLPRLKDPEFMRQIKYLIEDAKYDIAESRLEMALKPLSRPYNTADAALASNVLGEISSKQRNYVKAARKFRQAMHAAIACCGVEFPEAQKAYEGLRDLIGKLPRGSADVKSIELSMKFFSEVASEEAATTEARTVRNGKAITSSRTDLELVSEQGADSNPGLEDSSEEDLQSQSDDEIGSNSDEPEEDDDIGSNPGELEEDDPSDPESEDGEADDDESDTDTDSDGDLSPELGGMDPHREVQSYAEVGQDDEATVADEAEQYVEAESGTTNIDTKAVNDSASNQGDADRQKDFVKEMTTNGGSTASLQSAILKWALELGKDEGTSKPEIHVLDNGNIKQAPVSSQGEEHLVSTM